MKTTLLTLFLLVAMTVDSLGRPSSTSGKDLRSEWLVYEKGKFVPYADRQSSPEVIYLKLDARQLKSQYLEVKGLRPVNLFINNFMASSGQNMRLSIDSLATAFSSNTLLIAIQHRDAGHRGLSTKLDGKTDQSLLTGGLVKRETSFFRDFAVLAMLVLMAFAVVIVRLNPKLASDYFSVAGIISTRDIQESQFYTRIGSSTNILFYAYCSMLLAYYLMITFNFTTDQFPIANAFKGERFIPVVLQWLKLSAYVLAIFFLKIILVFGASYLFGMPQLGGIHFFNWVRLILVFFGVLTIILFIYFIWHGQSPSVHAGMLKLLGWLMGGWILLIFLKLAGNASASMFHLFSYICATELIPFLFIIKVLYK